MANAGNPSRFASNLIDTLEFIRDAADDFSATSLPGYLKRSSINSRVFIERSLFDESVTANLMNTVQSMYVGYVLAAMQMNTFVSKTKTVRDMLRTVATENVEIATDPFFQDAFSAIESFGVKPNPEAPSKTKGSNRSRDESTLPLPAGRMITLTLTDPETKNSVDVDVLIELSPYAIDEEVVKQFISMNIKPSLAQRYLQFKAGEISFWSDFVFQADLAREHAKALKKDKNGALADLLAEQNKAIQKMGTNFLSGSKDKYRNIANTIMIFEKSTFDQGCNDTGLGYNFNNAADRARFFSTSFAMILCVVDTMYSQVSIYVNGLDKFGTYTYRQLEKASTSQDGNLMAVMQAVQQGNMPRF